MSLKSSFLTAGICMTQKRIESRVKWDKELDVLPLYDVLSRFVKEKKLKPGDVFQYAVYTWCLRNPKNSGEEGRDIYKGKDYLRGGRSAGLLFSVGKLRGGDYYKGLHREKDLDLVCILADGSQLERSLYMLADFAGIKTPAMLVVTMMDVAKEQGTAPVPGK